ncbi:hypothetical protein Dda_1912 [Drechslerella dactyloides]|uniref:Uncharacterized protein n=1 Tax=Drechslerella dactyloides TaxID=74499 RepID=A0AAD6NLV6_DREDA|nr:hypothetical protein Dda_1912 [Drechslerella dactyloides]
MSPLSPEPSDQPPPLQLHRRHLWHNHRGIPADVLYNIARSAGYSKMRLSFIDPSPLSKPSEAFRGSSGPDVYAGCMCMSLACKWSPRNIEKSRPLRNAPLSQGPWMPQRDN